MRYYDREPQGQTPWYIWFIVFWMTIVTWIFGQLLLTGPFPDILEAVDPEAAATFTEQSQTFFAKNAHSLLLLGAGLIIGGLGAILAFIGLMVHFFGRRGKASLITGLIGVGLTFIGLIPFFMANSGMSEINNSLMVVIGLSPLAYALMLLTFPAALVGLYFGWTKLHERSLTALHTTAARFRWGRVIQSFFIMWIVLGAYALISTWFGNEPPRFVFDASRFLPFAVISLLLLPIQSATEEIVVRGYMNKGLIQGLKNKWVVFTLTSGLFMALHLANPEAQVGAQEGNLPLVMSGYFFFGFAACLMVLIDDGLESAIGVHAANNTFAGIFVNYENSVLPTPSIWQVKSEPNSDAISVIIILLVVLGLLWLTRKPRQTDAVPT